MKGLAYNSFQKIKIKRMQKAFPEPCWEVETPCILLSYLPVISLVLS